MLVGFEHLSRFYVDFCPYLFTESSRKFALIFRLGCNSFSIITLSPQLKDAIQVYIWFAMLEEVFAWIWSIPFAKYHLDRVSSVAYELNIFGIFWGCKDQFISPKIFHSQKGAYKRDMGENHSMLSFFFFCSHFSIVFSLLQKQSAAKIHIAKRETISLFEFRACFGLL